MKRFTLSTSPFAHGAATATFRCLMFKESRKSMNSLTVKAVLLSVITSLGLLNVLKISFKQSRISFELVDFVANNHVNRVNASMITI